MNIPAIGVARGIFELLIPGAFLILNAALVFYSVLDPRTQERLLDNPPDVALSLTILICFGYLAGVVMRLFGTEMPDRWSARWLRTADKKATLESEGHVAFWTRWNPGPADRGKFEKWAIDTFPYVDWLAEMFPNALGPKGSTLSETAKDFHEQIWANRESHLPSDDQDGSPKDRDWRIDLYNKTFFNFCKTVINSKDKQASEEIYSAEALVRYVTGMFYTLLVALALLAAGWGFQLIAGHPFRNWWFFPVMIGAYAFALWAIVRYYRILRLKEVGIVFSATFRHRELFGLSKPETQSQESLKPQVKKRA